MVTLIGDKIVKSVMVGNTEIGWIMIGETQVYTAEVIVNLTNSTNVSAYTLFSSEDWASAKRKVVRIPEGVTIGSASISVPSLRTGTPWGGELVIENAGSIQGAGGAANGGTGGNAFQADQPGVQLVNSGTIYAGGGGGGKGGTGGNGQYNYTHREPSSGWNYSTSPATRWHVVPLNTAEGPPYLNIYWNNTLILTTISNINRTSYTSGGWTYLRGTQVSGTYSYRIARQQTRTQATTGGTGGNGGRGQGYDQSRANGAAGTAGGTNAGAGGTGGSGGDWGVSGSQGNAGANGNVSNGTAGAAGGLAGYAIVNPANVSITNTGTILGRT